MSVKEGIMSAIGKRTKYVTCKIWDATRDDFTFPEIGYPQYKVNELDPGQMWGWRFREEGLGRLLAFWGNYEASMS
jgi:hypothetical protein